MKKRFLLPLVAIALPLGIGIADAAIHMTGCGLGHKGACKELSRRKLDGQKDNINDAKRCIKSPSKSFEACSRVDAEYIPEDLKEPFAVANKKGADFAAKQKADAEAKTAARLAAIEADTKKRNAKIIADQKAAEAKFKAEGWMELKPGIYGRWCTETCNNSKVIGRSTYWLMEVWAKDRSAGDIYARINITSNGTVVGWTNDTTYLSQGQKGILTFSTYQSGVNGAQLTEFNARG